MTISEIDARIRIEIGDNWDISNAHGVDLKTCLITPKKQEYSDPINESTKIELWTVLEETPDGNGYKICYNEGSDSFGLGMKTNKDELLYLGNYGSFLETLTNM
jgi:hypothetical protein